MYEDFVPERLAKLRTQKGVSARDMSLSLGQSEQLTSIILRNKSHFPAMQSFFYTRISRCNTAGIFRRSKSEPGSPAGVHGRSQTAGFKSMTHILGLMKELNNQKVKRPRF